MALVRFSIMSVPSVNPKSFIPHCGILFPSPRLERDKVMQFPVVLLPSTALDKEFLRPRCMSHLASSQSSIFNHPFLEEQRHRPIPIPLFFVLTRQSLLSSSLCTSQNTHVSSFSNRELQTPLFCHHPLHLIPPISEHFAMMVTVPSPPTKGPRSMATSLSVSFPCSPSASGCSWR